MSIVIGDIKTANKFYVKVNDSIEWVPTLSLAKRYVENPMYTDWFEKDIYATNEDLVLGSDGKTYLKSQCVQKKVELNLDIVKNTFKTQALAYIENKLLEFSIKNGHDNFYNMISWKNSSIKKMKADAEAALKYRDTIYLYHINFLETKIDTLNLETDFDISDIYSEYLKNFPA